MKLLFWKKVENLLKLSESLRTEEMSDEEIARALQKYCSEREVIDSAVSKIQQERVASEKGK